MILGAGAYLVLQDELTSGGMIAASILLGRALAPVDQTIGAWKSMVAARDAYGRIRRLLERFPPQPGEPLPAHRGEDRVHQAVKACDLVGRPGPPVLDHVHRGSGREATAGIGLGRVCPGRIR